MMTHADSPSDLRPGSERRRAIRVRPGPLRVRLHRTCEGILVDISETGALVQVPSSQAAQKHVTLQVEWRDAVVPLRARVIRSLPQRVQLATATLARAEYQVALEFSDISPAEATFLKTMVRGD
jgi:c-di-GMP-binding flagellar brake protein YcgR